MPKHMPLSDRRQGLPVLQPACRHSPCTVAHAGATLAATAWIWRG